MFTLHDNRAQLYQWDLNRKVIVNDSNICEVHFCNRTSDCSLVTEPYMLDGVLVADIPNILLQEPRPIRVYAYCDDQYTLTESQFSVKARTKPSDYVYEETTTIVLKDILARAEEATTNATAASEAATEALNQANDAVTAANSALETAEAAVSTVDAGVKTTQENAQAAQTAATEAQNYKEAAQGYAERAEAAETTTTQLKADVEEALESIPLAVQEAITQNPELLDSVTIDVTKCGTELTHIEITEDIRRFVESIKAGKDTLVLLKYIDTEFLATTRESKSGEQYHININGTPVYIDGESRLQGKYSFVVQIIDYGDGYVGCSGKRTPLSTFATEEYVDNAIANIDIPEADVDLSDYYTKEETDTAIYNSKDTYYLDFRDATEEEQPATADMIEFATRYDEGQNVCAHIRVPQNTANAITGWQPATVNKIRNRYVFTANAINPQQIEEGYSTPYYSFEVKNDSTAGWVYFTKNRYSFALATTDYVTQAIADSAQGETDLSNYYTKDEVNALFNGIATAEGGSY